MFPKWKHLLPKNKRRHNNPHKKKCQFPLLTKKPPYANLVVCVGGFLRKSRHGVYASELGQMSEMIDDQFREGCSLLDLFHLFRAQFAANRKDSDVFFSAGDRLFDILLRCYHGFDNGRITVSFLQKPYHLLTDSLTHRNYADFIRHA